MMRLIFWRLVQLPFLLMVIFTVTFILIWNTPGNPLFGPEGRQPAPEIVTAMNAQYNLDNSWKFATNYLWNLLTKFDFGPSFKYQDFTVSQIIADAFPVSLQLGLMALTIALFLGMAGGVVGAIRRGGFWDMATLLIALIGISLPSFVIGTLLLTIFSINLQWLPPGGWGSPKDAILPAFTLSLPFAAYIARLTRLSMLDIMTSDYIRTARAKGLSESRVIIRHAMKVAFLPVLSFMGPAAAGAMTGSFVVEKVFNIPGLGQHFVQGVTNKDIMLTLGVVLLYATILIVFNLIVDIAYSFVDPRISLD